MSKPRWLGPYLSYQSIYGGESLRTRPAPALQRLLVTLQQFSASARPVEATLSVYDEQNEALYRATRNDGMGPQHDEGAARKAAGQTAHPLAAPATERFGRGEARVWASGACGDEWVTDWKVDRDTPDFDRIWKDMTDFVLEHEDEPLIHAGWSDRRFGKPIGTPVEVTLFFEPAWVVPGTAEPLPSQAVANEEKSRIFLTLKQNPSVLLSLILPFARVDVEFAAWERAFCASLGHNLAQSRWSLVWLPEDFGHGAWKMEQGRYRRDDWTPEGLVKAPRPGPWDPLLDELLAPRLKASQEAPLGDELARLPLAEVALALLHRLGPLKGAPLERGQNLLRKLAEPEAGREALAPAVERLLAEPPATRQLRAIAEGLGPVGGDAWFVDLLQPYLHAKKLPTTVVDLVEAMYLRDDEAVDPAARARVLGTLLRRLRQDGAWTRRAVLRNYLGEVDDGRAWATWVLEAATPPKGYDDWEPWAWAVLRRWEALEKVRASAARPYLARLPQVELWGVYQGSEPVMVELDDAQRRELDLQEQHWLGLA